MVDAFPTIPNFNFNGSNPLADAVKEFQGNLSASGFLDTTIGDAATEAGEEFARRTGLSFNPIAVLLTGQSGPAELKFPQNIASYGNYMLSLIHI